MTTLDPGDPLVGVSMTNELRQRKTSSLDTSSSSSSSSDSHQSTRTTTTEQGPFGKTPDGTVFKVPETHDMLSSLFDPRHGKSHIDLITLFLLGLQTLLFFVLPVEKSRMVFLISFMFWRLSYNAGLGYLLTKQSKTKSIVKFAKQSGWFDFEKQTQQSKWVRKEFEKKMGKNYNVNSVPLEFNCWLAFRHGVDIILLNDFLSYLLFTLTFLKFPGGSPQHSNVFHSLRWIGGLTLLLFNLWVKVDAHRIVKDYAWYWGDAFFLSLQNLVFDGVFELAPHPMYSVGYAGYYAMSLITFSPSVLFVSLVAHACQFGFLNWFENPHIERVYGGDRKPLASRTPLLYQTQTQTPIKRRDSDEITISEDGGNVTESETLIDQDEEEEENKHKNQRTRSLSTTSIESHHDKPVSRHDLDNVYFRKDLLVFKNFDPFRTRDLLFGLLLVYSILPWFLPSWILNSKTHTILILSLNALSWRFFHTVILGLALKKQSENNWIVRHFLKHYHYEQSGEAIKDCFENWKSLYNSSLIMTYTSFLILSLKCFNLPTRTSSIWMDSEFLIRITLGTLLISLHVWSATSTFQVLGPFGWFYGDFFITSYPHELYYTGIYRFLNNPERSMGGAAFFGLVLISASKLVLVHALIAVFAHWWFLSWVENPHMKKLYGDTLRKDAGVTKTLRNATIIPRRGSSSFSSSSNKVVGKVLEVQGTVEKLFEETEKALEEFLKNKKKNHSVPSIDKVKGYVQDTTKLLLQQTGERLVISRVATDLASYDASRYSLSLRRPSSSTCTRTRRPPHASTSSAPSLRYHLGETITLDWTAPLNHSRKDWIGIYRLDGNVSKSRLVTKVSSQGKWLGVYSDEWQGDEYQEVNLFNNNNSNDNDNSTSSNCQEEGLVKGKVSFNGKKLPWRTGNYELRYHHDGKHSVMASTSPIEIYVEKPTCDDDDDDDFVVESRSFHQNLETMNRIVAKTLELDPRVIPQNSRYLINTTNDDSHLPTSPPPPPIPLSPSSSSSSLSTKKEKSKAIDQDSSHSSSSYSSSSLSSSSQQPQNQTEGGGGSGGDPNDFILYTLEQASHISYAIHQSFEIELDKQVVLAACNTEKLLKTVLEVRGLLGLRHGGTGSKSDRKDG